MRWVVGGGDDVEGGGGEVREERVACDVREGGGVSGEACEGGDACDGALYHILENDQPWLLRRSPETVL